MRMRRSLPGVHGGRARPAAGESHPEQLSYQLVRTRDQPSRYRGVENRQGCGVDLVVSEPTAGVEDVVCVVIDETLFLRSVDQMGEANLAPSIEAHTEGCFHGLQAASRSIDEVLVGVVAVHEHLA
jgi:hypothetical protein